jgi:HxlR-like helix-turn-helix
MFRPKRATQSNCPLAYLVDMIGGRWKVLAPWHLRDGTKRFTELRRLTPRVTQALKANLIAVLLPSSNPDCTRIDLLDFPILPDDHRSPGLDRTLDDLAGGLSKSGVR